MNWYLKTWTRFATSYPKTALVITPIINLTLFYGGGMLISHYTGVTRFVTIPALWITVNAVAAAWIYRGIRVSEVA